MKSIFFILIFLGLAGISSAQTSGSIQPDFRKEVFTNKSMENLPYRLLYPKKYNSKKKYPLVLFLHGAGSQGDDNESQLEEVPQMLLDAASSDKYACFVLAPQCPKDDVWAWFPKYPLWLTAKEPSRSTRLTLELLDLLAANLKIDRHRIDVTGLSLGGEGTFDIITRRPKFFAAAVPVCGIADTSRAEEMKNTPIWIFHGDNDHINPVDYSRDIVKVLKKHGGSPIYTEYKGVRHDSWIKAYQEPDLLNWMFSQRLK